MKKKAATIIHQSNTSYILFNNKIKIYFEQNKFLTFISSLSKALELGSKITPTPSSTTEITIMITDVNDELPKFKNEKYECEIAENSPPNTPLTFLKNAVSEVFDHDLVSTFFSTSFITSCTKSFLREKMELSTFFSKVLKIYSK